MFIVAKIWKLPTYISAIYTYLSSYIYLLPGGSDSKECAWETWIRSLSQEDPLEKEMAIHSSVLAWRIPWIEEPGRLQSMGSPRARYN